MRFLEQNRYTEQIVKKCKNSLPIFELAGNIPFVSPGEGSRPLTLIQDGPPVSCGRQLNLSGLSQFLKLVWKLEG